MLSISAAISVTMVDPKGRVQIAGFYDDVRAPTAAELEHVRNLPFEAEVLKKIYAIDGFAWGPIRESSPINRAVARSLEADPRACLVIAEPSTNPQRRGPRFNAWVSVIAPSVVVADLLEGARPLNVVHRKRERRLVMLEPTCC